MGTTTDPMFKCGPYLTELVERLFDMGCPPPDWDRVAGKHKVWLSCTLPKGRTERTGDTLELAARDLILLDLTPSDKDREGAKFE